MVHLVEALKRAVQVEIGAMDEAEGGKPHIIRPRMKYIKDLPPG